MKTTIYGERIKFHENPVIKNNQVLKLRGLIRQMKRWGKFDKRLIPSWDFDDVSVVLYSNGSMELFQTSTNTMIEIRN